MWIMLNDAFFSIVKKDCPEDHLMVRARRPGDIEKVFGRRHRVVAYTKSDYHYRCAIPFDEVARVMVDELRRVVYSNFKDSVRDHDLHTAYMAVWNAMARLQPETPYAGLRPVSRQPRFWDDPPAHLDEGSPLFDDLHDLNLYSKDEPQSAYRPVAKPKAKKAKRK